MHEILTGRSVWLLLLILWPVIWLTTGTASAKSNPVVVFVSVLPQKTFVNKIGGDKVSVIVMVKPGYSPATYEPTPQQMARLSEAGIYFRIGSPFESVWMERIKAANPKMRIVDARKGIALREIEDTHDRTTQPHGQGKASDENGLKDPHIWTSPPLVKHMSAHFKDVLISVDPGNRSFYEARFKEFSRELDRLDRDIRKRLAPLKNRKFLVFHPSWGYFADRYGLVQIPIESEGKTPGAQTLSKVIDLAKKENIRVVLVQKQFQRRDAQIVAEAIGAKVVTVDPLAEDYADNLRRVANVLAEAMT
jgi:zinc transport system substrate-binding protein